MHRETDRSASVRVYSVQRSKQTLLHSCCRQSCPDLTQCIVCVRARVRLYVCVCVWERETEREGVFKVTIALIVIVQHLIISDSDLIFHMLIVSH